MADRHTPEQRRKNMQAVKNKGSKIESLLAKKLWHSGLRYTKNDKSVFGKPDICFSRHKIAVFCDSEFWHGKDWEVRRHSIKSNQEFWYRKIESNIERDRVVNETLKIQGWQVIRFWGKQIEKDLDLCVSTVTTALDCRKP